jgi:Zn-dependent oligopeptidase
VLNLNKELTKPTRTTNHLLLFGSQHSSIIYFIHSLINYRVINSTKEMAIGVARLLLATNKRLPIKSSFCLADYVPRRYVREFPETRFDNSAPKDYLLILPERLDETNNELLRVPQKGDPETDFSKLNVEVCFKGLSQALCTFENFLTDIENQVVSPYNNATELFKDIEKHLFPLDSAYNIFLVNKTIHSQDYAYREIHDLIKRYYDVRARRFTGTFRESLRSSSNASDLSRDDKKMLKLYRVDPCKSSTLRPYDDSSMFLFQKNLNGDYEIFTRNLQGADQLFKHTIDEPDILAAVSSDFDDCQDLHHKERTPLQITTGTYHKFMQACPDRFVRQRLWQAYNRRCSPKGLPKYNNLPLIKSIRIWKRKIADLSGHRSHLDYQLQDTMASSRQRVMECLEAINKENYPKLQDRLQELTEFALDNKLEDLTNLGLREYDINYYSHRYVHDILIGFSETDLRSFFPFKRVMGGICDYFKEFFSIDMKLSKSDKFWSDQVRLIELFKNGQPLGTIIYDPFYRAPTNPYESIQIRLRSRVPGANHLPARFISTPFKIDHALKDAHLTVNDVLSLFYCFSSVIQELFYDHKYYELNTYGALERDVQDLLPNLCVAHVLSDHKILQSCSSRGGSKPIDSDLTNKILKAVTYFNPFSISHELYKAHLDHESHALLTDITTLAEEIHAKYSPFQRDPDNYDYCAMNQIFVGSDGGLQYSHLWSRQVASFCLAHNLDNNGKVDEIKFKGFLDKLVEALYRSSELGTGEKLTALVGKSFEPSEPILSVF